MQDDKRRLGTTRWGIIEAQPAQRNEPPQVVATRAYTEDLLRTGDLPANDREESALKAAMTALQHHYLLQAEPWQRRLADIYARKPIVITRFLDGTLEPVQR